MFGLKVSDAQCGFKAVKTIVAQKILPYVKNNDWFFDSEFLIIVTNKIMIFTILGK